MKKYLLIILLLLLNLVCNAQQVFQKHYTFNTWFYASKVLEIPGQGYFVIGIDDSLSVDSNGQPALDYFQGAIVKLNYQGDTIGTFQIGNGDTMYLSQFGRNSDDFFRSAIVTDDGNILVSGETQSYNAQNLYDYDLWLLKFNPNLDTLWTQRFSLPDSQMSLFPSISSKTQEDGIVVSGYENAWGGYGNKFMLAVFDSIGNLKFHKTLMPQFSGNLLSAIESSDHGFIATGIKYNSSVNFSDNSPIVIKTDSLGNTVWYKILPFWGDYHLAENIIKTQDGNYIFVWENVFYNSGAAYKMWQTHATKIDEQGIELWTKDYHYSFDQHKRIVELPNGNLMVSGRYTDTLGNGIKGFLMVCDSNGDSLWTRKFNGPPGPSPGSNPRCSDGTFTSDGGYILTGETYCCNFNPFFGWTSSLWILKTDSFGLITSVVNLPKPSMELNSIGNSFPNPTNKITTVSTIVSPTIQSAFLLLFDVTGRQLKQIKIEIGFNQTAINFSEYPAGEYVIALSVDGFNAGTKKIIKQ